MTWRGSIQGSLSPSPPDTSGARTHAEEGSSPDPLYVHQVVESLCGLVRRRSTQEGPRGLHKTYSTSSTGWRSGRRSTAQLGELREDLGHFVEQYNTDRPHQGRWCYGKTPMQTFVDSVSLAREKMLVA